MKSQKIRIRDNMKYKGDRNYGTMGKSGICRNGSTSRHLYDLFANLIFERRRAGIDRTTQEERESRRDIYSDLRIVCDCYDIRFIREFV